MIRVERVRKIPDEVFAELSLRALVDCAEAQLEPEIEARSDLYLVYSEGEFLCLLGVYPLTPPRETGIVWFLLARNFRPLHTRRLLRVFRDEVVGQWERLVATTRKGDWPAFHFASFFGFLWTEETAAHHYLEYPA